MNKGLNHLERFSWMLLQSLWVGGIWITILVVFPTLDKSVLAPILVYSVIAEIGPKIVLATVICVLIQLCLFVKALGVGLLLKSVVSNGLLVVLLLGLVFLLLRNTLDHRLHVLLYLTIGVLGVLLMFYLPPWLQQQKEKCCD